MREHEVRVPGIVGRLTVSEPGIVRGSRLLIDGTPAKKASWAKYELTRTDGSSAQARLLPSLGQFLPTLEVDGTKYPIGPKIPAGYVAIAFLPLVLIFVGGALGGAVGATGWVLNHRVARSGLSGPLKVLVMIAITGTAAGVFMVLASLFHRAIGR